MFYTRILDLIYSKAEFSDKIKRLKNGTANCADFRDIIDHIDKLHISTKEMIKLVEEHQIIQNAELQHVAAEIIAHVNDPDIQNICKEQLAKAVEVLSRCPVQHADPIVYILRHYHYKKGEAEYNYTTEINYADDKLLHHLNRVMYAASAGDYPLSKREFVERGFDIVKYWDILSGFSEVYHILSVILHYGHIDIPFTFKESLLVIAMIDTEAREYPAATFAEQYPVRKIPVQIRVKGIEHELSKYMTDLGYAAVTGDKNLTHIPAKTLQYMRDLSSGKLFPPQHEMTEDYYHESLDIYEYAMKMFRDLASGKGALYDEKK